MRNLLLIFTIIFFISSCNTSENQQEEIPENGTAQQDAEAPQPQKATEQAQVISDEDLQAFKNISSEAADQVINAYLEIKEALVNTNFEEAQTIAANVDEKINAEGSEGMQKIQEDINHIATTSSVEHQREHFKNLSKHVYALVKSTKAADQNLYKQYCPMAFDNTGAYWLSSSEEIRNPYFGDKMLKCGKVQETITNE